MEKLFQGLNSQEFLELYKLLVKTELLENITLFTRSEILERFAITQDFMICKYTLLRILFLYWEISGGTIEISGNIQFVTLHDLRQGSDVAYSYKPS